MNNFVNLSDFGYKENIYINLDLVFKIEVSKRGDATIYFAVNGDDDFPVELDIPHEVVDGLFRYIELRTK